MSNVNINIHLFCSNVERISPNDIRGIEQKIWYDVKNKANKQNIFLDFSYGSSDQCFCVIALKDNQTIQTCLKHLQKSSSFFVNNKGMSNKFKSPQLVDIFNSQKNNEFEWKVNIRVMEVGDSLFDRMVNYNLIESQKDRNKIFEIDDAFVVQYFLDPIN
jgi:hypothetical protein